MQQKTGNGKIFFCYLGCYVRGKKYEIGEEYKTPSDPCTTCICVSSAENQTCHSVTCAIPSCPNAILKDGTCCDYECPDENKCDKVCTQEYEPLCASNGETYSNLCGFEIAQCNNRQLEKMYDGECRSNGKMLFPIVKSRLHKF